MFIPEQAGEVWGGALAKGAESRAAELGPLEVVAGGPLAIGDDVTALRELARPNFALYIGGMGARDRNFYFNLACRYGFETRRTGFRSCTWTGARRRPPRWCRPGCSSTPR